MNDWIDISTPLRAGMVRYPDDPPVQIRRLLDLDRGGEFNLTHLSMCAHTGTHVDAPLHFLKSGAPVDRMPFSATVGPARVILIDDPVCIREEELAPHNIRRGERILFKTANSPRCWQQDSFIEDYVYIESGAARYLADRCLCSVGIDYLSVDGFHAEGYPSHHMLMEAGIWIIEGLDLSAVEPGVYDLICLPLNLLGSEGAPARAILRPREQ